MTLVYRLIAPVALTGVGHLRRWPVSQGYRYQLLLALGGFINRVCKIHVVSPKFGNKKGRLSDLVRLIFLRQDSLKLHQRRAG
ncbi:hypothetical protein [Mixta calida]|uniref:hypothetical protein n=1 Tax=Mixta calida TaxID=665913 RepID=UPI00403A9AFF